MTQSQIDTIGNWWARAKEIMTFATGVIVILGAIWAFISWSSGGLQLGSQVDLRDVKARLDNIQTDQAKAAQSAQSAQDKIIARLDALPRPSDYTNQETHLHQLDARVDTLRDDAVRVRADVDNLMRPPAFRNPR